VGKPAPILSYAAENDWYPRRWRLAATVSTYLTLLLAGPCMWIMWFPAWMFFPGVVGWLVLLTSVLRFRLVGPKGYLSAVIGCAFLWTYWGVVLYLIVRAAFQGSLWSQPIDFADFLQECMAILPTISLLITTFLLCRYKMFRGMHKS
jgi:hypothetical protein